MDINLLVNIMTLFFKLYVLQIKIMAIDWLNINVIFILTAPRNFKFFPGLKYVYQYDGKVDTVFDVERNISSTLDIKAVFELHFSTHCHGQLVVRWIYYF